MRYTITMCLDHRTSSPPRVIEELKGLDYDRTQVSLFILSGYKDRRINDRIRSALEASGYPDYDMMVFPSGMAREGRYNYALEPDHADSEFILFLNGGFSIDSDILNRLDAYISEHGDRCAYVMHRLPFPTGKHIDPVDLTMRIPDLDCFAISKKVLMEAGGFDPAFSYSTSEKDLSLRLSLTGCSIMYCPACPVRFESRIPDDQRAIYVSDSIGALKLSAKYLSEADLNNAERIYKTIISSPRHFESIRKILLAEYARFKLSKRSLRRYRGSIDADKARSILNGIDSFNVYRGRARIYDMEEKPLVSVVVRTHKRKDYLRLALTSIRNQTYDNLETIVVEDGADTSGDMINSLFRDMNVHYYPTGEHVGRGRAANIGIEKASADYVCLLDDDDCYYPDFVETFISTFLHMGSDSFLISGGMSVLIDRNDDPMKPYTVKSLEPVIFDHVTLMDMCVSCKVVSCSSAMFRKELYYECGGMREDIDGDEDWAMWLRFLTKYKRGDGYHTDIPKALNYFTNVSDSKEQLEREKRYSVFDSIMLSDPELVFTVTGKELKKMADTVLSDARHLLATGSVERYLSRLNKLGSENIPYDEDDVLTLNAMQLHRYYHYLMDCAVDR